MEANYLLVYSTFPTKEIAIQLCNQLIAQKLAACANIFNGHIAVYEWEGKIQNEQEFSAFMKTKKESFDALKDTLTRLHPYSCPCIIALEISDGNSAFLDWINTQVN